MDESIVSSVIVFQMGPGLVRTRRTREEAETPQGVKWNPGTKRAFEQGLDRPPDDCARAIVKLLKDARPEMSGQTFSAQDVLQE